MSNLSANTTANATANKAAAPKAEAESEMDAGMDLGANEPLLDAEAAASSQPAGDALMAEATARIQALEAEIVVLKDQALRAVAEAENTRRRVERDKEEAVKYAAARFARDILSVADNLRRALDAAPTDSTDEATKAMIAGVEATERELLSGFEKHGIKQIDPMGSRFDPNLHEAVFEVPGTGQPGGTVVQVLQAGYTLQDRLLRSAMVGVAKTDAGEGSTRVDTTA